MNRKQRRAQNKQLRVLKGGKREDAPPLARKQDNATPAGRLFNELDQFMRRQLASHPGELPLQVAVATLMQFTANLAASVAPEEAGPAQYGEASARLFAEEKAARVAK